MSKDIQKDKIDLCKLHKRPAAYFGVQFIGHQIKRFKGDFRRLRARTIKILPHFEKIEMRQYLLDMHNNYGSNFVQCVKLVLKK